MDKSSPGVTEVLPYESPPPCQSSRSWRVWVALGLYLLSMVTETSVNRESRPGWQMAFHPLTESLSEMNLFNAFASLVNGLFIAFIVTKVLIHTGHLSGDTTRGVVDQLSWLLMCGALVGLSLWFLELHLVLAFEEFERLPIGVALWVSSVFVLEQAASTSSGKESR